MKKFLPEALKIAIVLVNAILFLIFLMLVVPIEDFSPLWRFLAIAVMFLTIPLELKALRSTTKPKRINGRFILVQLSFVALRIVMVGIAFVVALVFLPHPY